jgi:hypothetical protein
MAEEPLGYLCETTDLATLKSVMRRLYNSCNDPKDRSPDARRDMANLLYTVLMRIEDVPLREGMQL